MSKKMFFAPIGGVSPYLANLVAYYKLNTNSNDFSGNSHNGADTSVSYANVGKVGNSATYNGSTSKTLIPQSTDFDFSNLISDIPFSFTMGVYFTGSGNVVLMCKFSNVSTGQWIIQTSGTRVQVFLFSNSFTFLSNTMTASLSTGVWYNLTVTYNGNGTNSGIKIYIDAVLQTVTNSNAGIYSKMPINNTPIGLGSTSLGTSFFFNGRLDEVYVWKNRELSALEISNAYTKFNAGQTLI
jgi:hypothetical protein